MLRELLRMRLFTPARVSGTIAYLPHFIRVFYRLMKDDRVSLLAKAAPFLVMALLLTPAAVELDFIPIIGEIDWIIVLYLALKLFVWLCPPEVVREHVGAVARGK